MGKLKKNAYKANESLEYLAILSDFIANIFLVKESEDFYYLIILQGEFARI